MDSHNFGIVIIVLLQIILSNGLKIINYPEDKNTLHDQFPEFLDPLLRLESSINGVYGGDHKYISKLSNLCIRFNY